MIKFIKENNIFDEQCDLNSKVYNALEDIAFETNCSIDSLEKAIDWFLIHFKDNADYNDEY